VRFRNRGISIQTFPSNRFKASNTAPQNGREVDEGLYCSRTGGFLGGYMPSAEGTPTAYVLDSLVNVSFDA
jgi:hypothetical protein